MPMRAVGNSSRPRSTPARRAHRARARRVPRPFLAVDLFDQDRELIATQARDCIARAHGRDDAAPGFDQQFVADRVADRVVDQLEAVEVEEQHRERASFIGPLRAR
jgi:hypothetical protein